MDSSESDLHSAIGPLKSEVSGEDRMVDKSRLPNAFEFVVLAGARARQLLAGSVPRVAAGGHKKTTIAQQEILARAVEKTEPVEADAGSPLPPPASDAEADADASAEAPVQ
jgi:DNA-directed RNA polymerase subunit K/omega